jgi:hypothetical protein
MERKQEASETIMGEDGNEGQAVLSSVDDEIDAIAEL